jgi:hypothetical protein
MATPSLQTRHYIPPPRSQLVPHPHWIEDDCPTVTDLLRPSLALRATYNNADQGELR